MSVVASQRSSPPSAWTVTSIGSAHARPLLLSPPRWRSPPSCPLRPQRPSSPPRPNHVRSLRGGGSGLPPGPPQCVADLLWKRARPPMCPRPAAAPTVPWKQAAPRRPPGPPRSPAAAPARTARLHFLVEPRGLRWRPSLFRHPSAAAAARLPLSSSPRCFSPCLPHSPWGVGAGSRCRHRRSQPRRAAISFSQRLQSAGRGRSSPATIETDMAANRCLERPPRLALRTAPGGLRPIQAPPPGPAARAPSQLGVGRETRGPWVPPLSPGAGSRVVPAQLRVRALNRTELYRVLNTVLLTATCLAGSACQLYDRINVAEEFAYCLQSQLLHQLCSPPLLIPFFTLIPSDWEQLSSSCCMNAYLWSQVLWKDSLH